MCVWKTLNKRWIGNQEARSLFVISWSTKPGKKRELEDIALLQVLIVLSSYPHKINIWFLAFLNYVLNYVS